MKSVTWIATISMLGWCDSVGDGCVPIASDGATVSESSSGSTAGSGTATSSTGTASTPTEATTVGPTTGTASATTTDTASTTTGEVTATTGEVTATTTAGTSGSTSDATSDGTSTTTSEDTSTTGGSPPEAPVLKLKFSQTKQFDFTWEPAPGATSYRLLESPTVDAPFVQIPDMNDIFGEKISLTMPLHLRWDASYRLLACNDDGCTPSADVQVVDSLTGLTGAIGYFKASNTGAGDNFGYCVAISADGNTLAVGAPGEKGTGKGIEPPHNDAGTNVGAVYVFARVAENAWVHQAYIKASQGESFDTFGNSLSLSSDGNILAVGAPLEDGFGNGLTNSGAVYVYRRLGGVWQPVDALLRASNAGAEDRFGHSVALSADGKTLAVGAYFEDSSDIGINGMKNDNAMKDSGAVYVFAWANPVWVQQAYVKPSNTAALDEFGKSVAISSDGDTLAVGARMKDGEAGAAYVFVRSAEMWSQQTMLKASNSGMGDRFGMNVAISADGDVLAVGAYYEDSPGAGVDGEDGDDVTTTNSGAAYVFVRTNDVWSQTAYVKASNPDANDWFGLNLALSPDGTLLAVTARDEDGGATGLGGVQEPNTHTDSGAVYVFERTNETWSQRSYVKASNTGAGDRFGLGLALSGNGILAVGADLERSKATGINKDQTDNSAIEAGAVYVY